MVQLELFVKKSVDLEAGEVAVTKAEEKRL